MRNMVNKNIKRMLLFVTLCILLVGIVSAEDLESDDSAIPTDTISDHITDSVNTVSEVNDNVVNDNTEDLKKDVKTEKTIKTATTKTKTKVSIDPVSDVSIDDWVLVMGTLTDINNNPIANAPLRIDVNGDDYNTETNDYGDFFGEYIPDSTGLKTITVSYTGNSKYEATSAKSTFTVKGQTSTYITLNEIKDTTVGNTVKVSGHYYYGYEKPLTYTTMRININGQAYTAKTDNNGYFTYNYKTTKTGTNNVTVSYPGNTNFKSAKETATFYVNPVGPQYTYITLNYVPDVAYGGYTTISGYYYYGNSIPLTATTMRLNINGKQVTAKTDKQGYFTYSYKTERVGKNTVTVSYPGNTNFKSATATKTFNVKITSPIYTYISLNSIKEVTNGQTTTISGYYYYGNNIPLIQTTMRLNINGKTYTAKTNDKGYFTYNYKTSKDGSNTVTVSYPGNTNFQSATATKTFNVKSVGPQYTYIVLDSLSDISFDGFYYPIVFGGNYYYGNNIPLTDTLMRININGVNYTRKTFSDGSFFINRMYPLIGKNIVTVSYPGNSNFKAASITKTFYAKITSPLDTVIYFDVMKNVTLGESVTISGVYLSGDLSLTHTTMRININGQQYTAKTDDEGYFTFNYKTTKAGTNTVTVSYPGNNNFKGATETQTFNVKSVGPQDTYIKLNNIKEVAYHDYTTISGYYYYGNDIPLTSTNMRININGETHTVKTDNKGYFKYDYYAEKVYKNTVTVSYPGNTNFKGATATKSFNVKITSPIDTHFGYDMFGTEEFLVKLGDYKTFEGYYLYGSAPLPLAQTAISLNINGQKYTTKTNNEGIFRYTFKTTKPGLNKIIVSYPGNSNFKGNSDTFTFNVYEDKVSLNIKPLTNGVGERVSKSNDVFEAWYQTYDAQHDKGIHIENYPKDATDMGDAPYNLMLDADIYFKDSQGNIWTETSESRWNNYLYHELVPGYTPYKVDIYYRKMTQTERKWHEQGYEYNQFTGEWY